MNKLDIYLEGLLDSDSAMFPRGALEKIKGFTDESELERKRATCGNNGFERERDSYKIFIREIHQALSDVICDAAPIMPDSPYAPLLALHDKLYEVAVKKKLP